MGEVAGCVNPCRRTGIRTGVRRAKTKPVAEPLPIPWPKLLQEAQSRFGIRRFRPGQKDVIASVLAGRNTLALMPTGAGKSLTYQLPALFLPKPVIVVSPLIALMQDQQEKAEQADVVVEKLDSTVRQHDREKAHEEIAGGTAQLIYVTPEKLQDQTFLAEVKDAGGISLLVIDEAHTISQWGHDFRPAFQSIGEARRMLGNPPVLALTATATEEVIADILHSLHAEDAVRISTGIERPNLGFAVHPTVNNEAKVARILAMIKEDEGSGIIYTASVRAANELFELLTEQKISAGHYHGKMGARDRERVQQEFMRGDHRVMIATKAFGLGIDKPDIRFVYHFEFPDSLETYYQEAGRAGRDGLPAKAVLLYRLEDKRIQTYFQAGRYPKPAELEAVYEAIAWGSERDSDSGGAGVGVAAEGSAEAAGVGVRRTQVILNLLTEAGIIRREGKRYGIVADRAPDQAALESLLTTYTDRAMRDKDRLAEMMHYAESPACRVQMIRGYFGEPEAEPCGSCDNCRRGVNLAAAGDGWEAGSSASHPAVVTVETATGSIRTTAPETLPVSKEASFQAGDKVRHKRFGPGQVLDVHNDNVLVAFSKSGQKRLRASFLSAA